MRRAAYRAGISAGPSTDSVGNTIPSHLVHRFIQPGYPKCPVKDQQVRIVAKVPPPRRSPVCPRSPELEDMTMRVKANTNHEVLAHKRGADEEIGKNALPYLPPAYPKMTNLIVDFPSRRMHDNTPSDAPSSTSTLNGRGEKEPKQQRRVSFANVSQMKVVADIATDDALPDLYYTKREIQAIKRCNCRMLMAIRASGVTMAEFAQQNLSKTEVFMGLEAHLDVSVSNEMRMRRSRQIESVLEEQSRQRRRSGVININHADLARVSARYSEWARVRARIIGQIHDDRPGGDVVC
ncbi:hypothetical protein THAOC_24908 [Thalassiosira oceanica]|uniref:Uncharacterized protein n=1 Tax=Thalassiosira oceanica TaxID=159749 RepID=K0RNM2_THAOC|nr:hypothetical protein THAOC_24908 [Thalassiosira oceanica]|eukprot:EJK55363.1 hypothetical protein THAOC_24908 [Thalassiosira oceanica]